MGKKKATEGSEGRYSLKTLGEKNIVWIEHSVLSNKELQNHVAVAWYIAEHIGEMYTILESGQNVYIGAKLPAEYTHSKYTSYLRERNYALLKDKNRATNELGLLIETATNRRGGKTNHTKNKDAKYGMYRYDSSFYMQRIMKQEPNLYADKLRVTTNADEILQASRNWVNEALLHPRQDAIIDFARGEVLLRIGGNNYSTQVVVGNRGDSGLLLYDIINLNPASIQERTKKSGAEFTGQPHKAGRTVDSSTPAQSAAPASDVNSVPRNGEKSNTDISTEWQGGAGQKNPPRRAERGSFPLPKAKRMGDLRFLTHCYLLDAVKHTTSLSSDFSMNT